MKNWLGWFQLIGSMAGIISAVKLFLASKWLNQDQRMLLVATYISDTKYIMASRVLGGGWKFLIPGGGKGKGYSEYFVRGGKNIATSYQILIYLKELVDKGYFVYAKENSGIKGLSTDMYYLAAKGMRYGRFLQYIAEEPNIETFDDKQKSPGPS